MSSSKSNVNSNTKMAKKTAPAAAPAKKSGKAAAPAKVVKAAAPKKVAAPATAKGPLKAIKTAFNKTGLLAHVANAPDSWRRKLLPPLCFVLALGVKETAVTFPLALLLWD